MTRTIAISISLCVLFFADLSFCWQDNFTNDFVKSDIKLSKFELEFKRLTKLYSPKSEYETTTAYENRINLDHKIMYFLLPSEEVISKYDADTSSLMLSLRKVDIAGKSVFSNDDNQPHNRYIVVTKTKTYESEYLAGNAFGGSVVVSKTKTYSNVLQFSNFSDFPFTSSRKFYIGSPLKNPYRIIITLSEAKQLSGNISVIIACRPNIPVKEKDIAGSVTNYSRAKFDFPYETEQHLNYINVDLLGAIFFNSKTKKILFRSYDE